MRMRRVTTFLRAYLLLLRFDAPVARGDFAALRSAVRSCPVVGAMAASTATDILYSAIDFACICYWKEVRCLQRSAALCCLLKRSGISAQVVIGAQVMPFEAHAWVEIGGRVVHEISPQLAFFGVLDRF
jgi:hypothetical protein